MSTIDLSRRSNESELDFQRRIIYGKLVDKTLADYDYSELAELIYGQSYSSDFARRLMYGSLKTLEVLDKCGLPDGGHTTDEIDAKIIELKKERQRFIDQRTEFNKVVRNRSRQEELNDIIVKAVSSGDLPELEYVPHHIANSDNDLLVSLNDIHYGVNIDNAWNKYNSDICRRMMTDYIDKIVSIAKLHNSENCICWMNGDAISGNIHYSIAVSNKENVIQQLMGVSELISDFIAALSPHFRTVTLVSVAGNHSRINPNKDNAITAERLDDIIEWYVKARLQNFDNVLFEYNKVDPTMYTIDVRGKTYVGIHGDWDAGDTKVQALQTLVGKPVYAVLSGHLHHNKVDVVQGIKTVMAGSFMGMDDYCVQKRIYGKPEQMVCVCTTDGISCYYDVAL